MKYARKLVTADTLRTAYPVLNIAIDNANEAATVANVAEVKSTKAEAKAVSVQKQLDNLIVEGDSSVEAAAARVREVNGQVKTFDTLKARMDDTDVTLNAKASTTAVDAINNKVTDIQNAMSGVTFASTPQPVYLAHRGAKLIFPEASVEAFRGCVNMGLTVLEMDIRRTVDGTLICHHDDTMERTTNKTGSVDNYSAMGFKSAKIDTLPGWDGTPCLFEDLLREFGNKVIYAPELKGPGLSEVVADTILKYRLENNVIIQSFSAPDLVYSIGKGIPTLYLRSNTDIAPSQIYGWGIRYVGLSTSLPDSYVTDCLNAGLKVYMYTVNYRYLHDKYKAMGVHGFFSDDPMWIRGNSPVLEWDPYRDQVFSIGHFSPDTSGTGGDRGTFIAPNRFGWPTSSENSDFSLQGWAGKLATNFQVDTKIRYAASSSSVRWASVAFCTPNDFFDDYTSGRSDGYHVLVRESGSIELYIRNGGGAVQLTSMSTASISQGQVIDLRVKVAGSTITITRVDTNDSMNVTNSVHRQGYLHFGRRYTGATFENVRVQRQ